MTQLRDALGCVSLEDGIENKDIGGFLDVEVIRDGPRGPEVVERRRTHNLITNTGKKLAWRVLVGLGTKTADQGRIGTSGAAAASNQTNCLSPITATLQTVDTKTLLSGTRTIQLVWSYPSGGGSKSVASIEEACILNQNTSPGGTALMRAVFTAVGPLGLGCLAA